MALTREDEFELNSFLSRLQGQEVRVELSSRLNTGYRFSFSVKLEKTGEDYHFTSDSGELSIFIKPTEAEGFSSDHTSVTLLYADELITVRHARTR